MANWKELAKLPCNGCSYSVILKNTPNSILAILDSGMVLTYCDRTDTWNELQITNQLPDHFFDLSKVHAVSVDSINHRIYFLQSQGMMAMLQMKENQPIRWKIIKNLVEVGDGSQGLMINNEFHAIGGRTYLNENNKSKHVIYNDVTKKLEISHEFDYQFAYHRLVKIKDSVLLFGGVFHKKLKDIYEYKIRERTWNLLSVSMPVSGLNAFGCVEVLNGQYILFFCWSNSRMSLRGKF